LLLIFDQKTVEIDLTDRRKEKILICVQKIRKDIDQSTDEKDIDQSTDEK
jgi:hypothetical protein